MKKLSVALFSLLLMLIMAALAVPFLIPAEEYKAQALHYLQQQTGREVKIAGAIRFSLLPQISLNLEEVLIANPAGAFTSPHLAKIEKLSLAVALSPLLRKQIVVESIEIEKPDIWLENNGAGQNNWSFASEKTKNNQTEAAAIKSEADFSVALKALKVKAATLRYLQRGNNLVAENVSAQWAEKELSLTGQMNYKGLLWQLAGKLQNPEQALQGKVMPLSVVLESEVLSVLMDGEVNLNPADIMKSLTLAGKFNFSAPSLKNLAQHLSEGSSPMPDEKLSLQTLKARITPKSFAAQAATLNMGDKEAIGSFELAWGGKRPSLTGDFTLNEIHWPLVAQTSPVTEKQKETQASAKGWDAAPMDFSGLRKMDMAVTLNVAEVVTPNLTLKDVAARVSLKAGKLGATITKASLLEGQGTGQLMLDASAAMSEWQLALQGKGLDATSVQKLMLPETKVTGVVAADIQLASRGHSHQQWMENLYGQGNLTLQEGVVQGYHLPALFSNLKAERRVNLQILKTQKPPLHLRQKAVWLPSGKVN